MLLNFSVKNYRSFRDEVTLSLAASSERTHSKAIHRRGAARVLPVAVIYGANSSGKTNVLYALRQLNHVVKSSVKLNPSDPLDFEPFFLDENSQDQPTQFEIEILIADTRYRYGFEYNAERICREWLYAKQPKEREFNLFIRVGDEFEISAKRFPEGIGKEVATLPNRLFLSLVAQLRGNICQQIMEWFYRCNFLSGMQTDAYAGYSMQMFNQHLDGEEDAFNLFNRLNLGFNNLIVSKRDISGELDRIPSEFEPIRTRLKKRLNAKTWVEVHTTHTIYDRDGNPIGERTFNSDEMESEGTKKIIEMSGPLFAAIKAGGILIVDELDSKLHPLLTRDILRLFMDPESNPSGAQLIFTTHDTNLLNRNYLRRDQIWFTEKNAVSSTDLYSLAEFRDTPVGNSGCDPSLAREYIAGRYGAIPYFS